MENYILTSSLTEQRVDSDLVLSSSILKIKNTLTSFNGDFILSASGGSSVVVSGSLSSSNEALLGSMRLGSLVPALNGGSIGGSSSNVHIRTAGTAAGTAGNVVAIQDVNGNYNPNIAAAGFQTKAAGVISWDSASFASTTAKLNITGTISGIPTT